MNNRPFRLEHVMRIFSHSAVVLIAGLFTVSAAGQSKPLLAPTLAPATRAAQAEMVVTGKVVEIEKDAVEGPAYAGAPKDQRLSYKIAVVKIEDRPIGAKGLTQVRVGFPANAPAVAPGPPADTPPVAARLPRARGRGAVALTAAQEGCFMLDQLPGADFFILSGNGPPVDKKDENYAKQFEAVQKVAKAL